jgi:hypothetical protein
MTATNTLDPWRSDRLPRRTDRIACICSGALRGATIATSEGFMLNWLLYTVCFAAVLCTTSWRLAKSAIGMR